MEWVIFFVILVFYNYKINKKMLYKIIKNMFGSIRRDLKREDHHTHTHHNNNKKEGKCEHFDDHPIFQYSLRGAPKKTSISAI